MPQLIGMFHPLLYLLLAIFSAFSLVNSAPIEVPETMPSNGTLYSISPFSPKVFAKTDEFMLNYNSCVQYSYKLMDRKVRLRAYTCLMSEGGFCTLDKFAFPKDHEGCAYLRPWLYREDSYSFYFVLERRARKYRAGRKRPRRISKRNGELSATPFGQLQVDGIMPCSQVCGGRINRTT